MFPTRGKVKISKTLAYPLKAKAISEALADVPQSQVLSLWFFNGRSLNSFSKLTKYPVVRVEYTNREVNQFTPHFLEEAGWNEPKWSIRISAVPVEIKHHIAQLLQEEAFPKIHAWLCAHEEANGKEGCCSYNVFYDEEKEQLEYSQRDITL